MLRNYLTTALRSLRRHKFFSLINIFGLAIAMSICMIMIMLVADQMSYDRYNTAADRIYRITTLNVDEKGNVMWGNQYNSATCDPLAPTLLSEHTGIEDVVRLRRGFGNGWLEFEGKDVNLPLSGFFADASTLEFFQYELQYGDAATALKAPFSVVLTRKAADKLFKEENPVGQTLKVGEQGLYTVTGVLKENDRKSHIVFEGLASMSTVKSLEDAGTLPRLSEMWLAYYATWTYIRAEEGKTIDQLQAQLDEVYFKHVAPSKEIYKMRFFLQPLLSITPGELVQNSIGPQLPWELVYFLGGLALVILLTSCFNFTNLSIARSLTRAREIGVRKVAGAARRQIFFQFISESVVVALVSLAIAVVLLILLKPMILQLTFAQMFHWDLYNGIAVYAIFAVFALVVGVMAGFFPAVVLSGFQPVSVLKNLNNMKLFSRMGMRKALLVSQFALSLFFIVTVIAIYNQMNLMVTKEHGFNMDSNIMVTLNSTSYQNLKAELEKYSNITAVTGASHVPAAGTTYGAGIKRKFEDPEHIDAGYFYVDEDYATNMNLRVVAGKFFTPEAGSSNENFVVINEAAVRKLDFKSAQDAVGEAVIISQDSTSKTIAAVVADYNHRDLIHNISPLLLMYRPDEFKVVQIAFAGTYDNAVKSVGKAWAAVNPGLKVNPVRVESEINKYYEMVFGDLVGVLGFISFLAILISCLGLLGMATYATETRIKEISIRKILGSGDAAIVLLLSRGFLTILSIAIMVGVPLAWMFNTYWLEQIAYHTTVDAGMIIVSVLVLMFFAVVTIGSQTLRAVVVNPVDNLKSE
jgi:putative ABC transport system permease protein